MLQPRPVRLTLLFMIFSIGVISAYDNVLCCVTIDTLEEEEQNPMALMIIKELGVAGLVVLKALGTLIASVIMVRLVYSKYYIAIVPVFIFQCFLLFYLSFYADRNLFGEDFFYMFRRVYEFCLA
jgi:hypothetical protein